MSSCQVNCIFARRLLGRLGLFFKHKQRCSDSSCSLLFSSGHRLIMKLARSQWKETSWFCLVLKLFSRRILFWYFPWLLLRRRYVKQLMMYVKWFSWSSNSLSVESDDESNTELRPVPCSTGRSLPYLLLTGVVGLVLVKGFNKGFNWFVKGFVDALFWMGVFDPISAFDRRPKCCAKCMITLVIFMREARETFNIRQDMAQWLWFHSRIS